MCLPLARRRRQPPKHGVKRHPDREQAAVAACRAVQLETNRQCACGAKRDRKLDAGNAGIAAGIGVLNEQAEIFETAGIGI